MSSVVMGRPVQATTQNIDAATEGHEMRSAFAESPYLSSIGLPSGVIKEFQKSCVLHSRTARHAQPSTIFSTCPPDVRRVDEFPMRTWIIDNSGSMATADSHRIISAGGRDGEISSTRWEELSDAIIWHGSLASHMQAPTTFRLLNPPGKGQPQVITCGNTGNVKHEIEALKGFASTGPTGRTPLCEHIRAVTAVIKDQVREHEPTSFGNTRDKERAADTCDQLSVSVAGSCAPRERQAPRRDHRVRRRVY